jgi:hypothetical protein
MTQRLTQLFAIGLLLVGSVLACGKYGPPVRSSAAAPANVGAAPAAAPGASAASCEEDPEKKTP